MIEGSAEFEASAGKISKKLEIFYNPVMKLNRDITILLLNSVNDKDMQVALPLAGSGVRAIRMAKELDPGKVKSLSLNDISPTAIEVIKKNLKANVVDAQIHNEDANMFLLRSKGFDYIDIDPFGSPNPFLDASITRLARGGILAVTATDTASLAGSSPTACMRKYWAKPLRNEFMHETAIRILIRKVQLIGAQHDKALSPIFSYYSDHYYRVFLRCEKGKLKADEVLKQHAYLIYDDKTMERDLSQTNHGPDFAGPLWTGDLWQKSLVDSMHGKMDQKNQKLISLLDLIRQECRIKTVGFYDLHKISKRSKKDNRPIEELLSKEISRTHFLGWGVRTRKSIRNLLDYLAGI